MNTTWLAISDKQPTPAQLSTRQSGSDTKQHATEGHGLSQASSGWGTINQRQYFEDGITYHSIQIGVTRRLSNNLSFSVAYTGTRRAGLQGWDWYRTDADNFARFTTAQGSRPHNLVIGYSYQFPDVSKWLDDNAIAKGFLDGWQLSGVTTVQGGTRGGFTYAFTGAPTGDLTQGLGGSRVSLACDPNLPRKERTFDRQFRTECVVPPDRSRIPRYALPGQLAWR
jgi:hypothetical protein